MEVKEKTAHTPTPWTVMNGVQITTVDASAGCIATTHKNAHADSTPQADAEFIVRAVNSHEKLIEIAKCFKKCHAGEGFYTEINVDALITEAEGKS